MVVNPLPFVITISNGSFAFVKLLVLFATTPVNCVALFLVTLSSEISVPPSVLNLNVADASNLEPVTTIV